ncbi:MAG: hypothetical protein VX379_04140 [Pseudomonadota bacterium]|nr:hypothetical protein [Pseudomonadota bacterium]MEE3322099.1 hypothetical protein [Pseudomonadota bacterium]
MLRIKLKTSPYIANPNRLADLIAAIQVLGTYRFASRSLDKWEKRLGRTPVSAPNWETVFKQHPEFFTTQRENISVVWRRSRERNYDTYSRKLLPREEVIRLAEDEKKTGEKRLSRPPLAPSEVTKLVEIAISLHEREIKHAQERRWWITAVVAVASLIIAVAGT